MDDDDQDKFGGSPGRAKIRREAYARMQKQASKMKKRAFTKDGHFTEISVGTVVQLGAADVDRAKTDVANITGVVVEHVHMEDSLQYRVAAHAGTLKTCYARHQLRALRTPPGLLGLDSVLQGWRLLPEVGERACMRLVSAVGGQGVVHCATVRVGTLRTISSA